MEESHKKMDKESGNPENWREAKSIYDFSARSLDGENVSLKKYKDCVCIIVNIAFHCGYMKNHIEELKELYEKFSESKGLRILAFPCNQFANQMPENNDEIKDWIDREKIKFDVFEKIDVNGSEGHPLWKYLKHEQGGLIGDFIKWNFTKFIVDKNGKPVERHGPNTSPKELEKSLENYW
ncbi:probable phospholipid hydroperoxide glutathione peroxidase [Agrilus planipennis]|uniref:Glutathione peroxidase n=1 Tax=Agrilus planipennis TaxID=224129 RepID=A0A1W4WMT2_AGRPL|nr:probable phospholipid hydroperoxide glutathione peroxidase [Agrilus planipennis]